MKMTNMIYQICALAIKAFSQRFFSCLAALLLMLQAGQAYAVDNAQFVSQSVPSTMTAGETYSVSISMKNTGTVSWTSPRIILGPQNPENNVTFGVVKVGVGTTVAVNAIKVFTFNVIAPSTPGTYNMQWRVAEDNVAYFGQLSTNVAVNVVARKNDALVTSQTYPQTTTPLTPTASYYVAVTVKNTGNTTWKPGVHRLGLTNPPDTTTWRATRRDITSAVAPGSSYSFPSFTVSAPATPGYYNLQAQMLEETVEWFGTPTTNVRYAVGAVAPVITMDAPLTGQKYYAMFPGQIKSIVPVRGSATAISGSSIKTLQIVRDGQNPSNTVSASTIDTTLTFDAGSHTIAILATDEFGTTKQTANATFTAYSEHSSGYASSAYSMVSGQSYPVSVTLTNQGSSTWQPASYRLISRNPDGASTWGISSVSLPTTVAPGATITLPFNVTAPMPGVHNMQWGMAEDTRGPFGVITAARSITVTSPPPGVVFSVPTNNAVFQATAATGTAQVPIKGSASAGAGFSISKLEVLDAGVVIATVNSATMDTSVSLLSGSHTLQLRATDNYGSAMTSAVSNVTVTANGATFVSQSVPSTMTAGQTYTATVTMKNTGTTTWTPASKVYSLGAQNPQDNTNWRTNSRVVVPAAVAPGAQQTFSFTVTAPSMPGTYDFQWQMVQDLPEWFGAVTPNMAITVTPRAPTATLVAPATGGTYLALNGNAAVPVKGSATVDQSVGLARFEVLDGAAVVATSTTNSFDSTVMLSPGTHVVQLRTTDNNGSVALSGTATVTVLYNNAEVVWENAVPAIMEAGKTYPFTMQFKNTGTTTWNPGAYSVGTQSPPNNTIWRDPGRAAVETFAPGETMNWVVVLTAPSQPGTYPLQWQMSHNSGEWFGAPSTLHMVNVVPAAPTVTLTVPAATATYLAAGTGSAVVPVQGSAAVHPSATVTALEVLDGETVVATFSTSSINTTVSLTSGTHVLKLRVTDSYGSTAISSTATVTVLHNNAQFVDQTVAPVMEAGKTYPVTFQVKNTGTSTWQPGAYALASQNPADNTIWRASNRVALAAAVAPNSQASFSFDVVAPAAEGSYDLQWAMVEEGKGTFGTASNNVSVTVLPPVGPTATLAATPASIRVQAGQSANITLTGGGNHTAGLVTKLEVFKDAGAGYEATPVLTLNGNAASLALEQTLALPYGSYRLKLRATDGGGRKGESIPVIVNVADNRFMGGVLGIRAVSNKVELGIWVQRDSDGAPLPYAIYVNAPSSLGGILIASGTLNSTGATQSRGLKRIQQVEEEYWVDVSDANTGHPEAPVFPEIQPPGGGPAVVLPGDGNGAVMPGKRRIGLTSPSPLKPDHVKESDPVFLRAIATDFAGPANGVQFSVDGSWMAADNVTPVEEGHAYSLTVAGLHSRTAPYEVQARIGQGNTLSEKAQFYIDAGNAITLLTPSNGQKLLEGDMSVLAAMPSGETSAVQAVSFYVDDKFVGAGVHNNEIWTYGWTAVPGVHTIHAKSTDGSGTTVAQTAIVSVSVSSVSPPAGNLPVMTAPPHLDNPDAGSLPGRLNVGSDGAASYNLPLVVPPGIAGIQPNLSLNYSSNSGNGMLGLGWSMAGLSTIQRCAKTIAQDVVPGRINFDNADRLCMDGQRLVRASGSPSTSVDDEDAKYWANDAEYRTELDNFTRISRVLGGTVFKVEPKSGEVYYYGMSTGVGSGSSIPAQGRTDGKPMLWALGKMQDRSGNVMEVDYGHDGVTGEYLPKQIRYGGHSAAEAADSLMPTLAVRFAYEPRSDAQIQYVGGSRNDLRSRLTHIATYIGTDADGSGGTLVRDYEVHYASSNVSGRSLIDWVQVCAVATGSGNCEKLPKTTFEFGSDGNASFKNLPITPFTLPEFGSPISGGPPPLQMKARLDGSGQTNFVAFQMDGCSMSEPNCLALSIPLPYSTGKLRIRTANGDEVDSTVDYKPTGLGLEVFDAPSDIQFGDFDGDGRDDMVVRKSIRGEAKWGVCLNTSSSASAISFSCLSGRTGFPTLVELRNDRKMHLITEFNSEGKASDCYYANSIVGIECVELKLKELAPLPLAPDLYDKLGTYSFFKPTGINMGRQSFSDFYSVWKAQVPALDPSNAVGEGCMIAANGIERICGKMDLIQGVTVCFNQQNGLSCQAAYQTRSVGNVLVKLGAPVSVGDLNGDGLTDFIFTIGRPVAVGLYGGETPLQPTGKEGVYVCLSKENGVDCQRDSYVSFPNADGTDALATGTLDDFMGDGVTRILFDYKADGAAEAKTQLCRYSATGFNCAEVPYLGKDVLDTESVYLNGSGVPGFLKKTPNKINGKDSWQAVTLEGAPSADRLVRVTNGIGHSEEISYARGDDSIYSRVALVDGVEQVPAYPMISAPAGVIVKQSRASNGQGGWLSNDYSYQGHMRDAAGRGSLGFAVMAATDTQSGIVTEQVFSQELPYIGMAKRSRQYINACDLSYTTNSLQKYLPPLSSGAVSYFAFVKQVDTQRKDLDCSALGSIKIDNAYTDGLGNLNQQTVTTSGGGLTFSSTVSTKYYTAAAEYNHLIGLPLEVTVSKTDPDSGTSMRTVAYTYDAGTGLRKTETVEPNAESLKVLNTYERDDKFGLIKKHIQNWTDPACADVNWPEAGCTKLRMRTMANVSYENNGRFPASILNALNQEVTRTYDQASGALRTATDLNGLKTIWTTDGFGRVTSELRPDGGEARYYYKRCSPTLCPQRPDAATLQITEQFHSGSRIAVPQMQYRDSAGHLLRAQTVGFDGHWNYVDNQYDSRGRLILETQPADYSDADPPLARRLGYDDLDRVTSVLTLDDNGKKVNGTATYQGHKRVLVQGLNDLNSKSQQRTETRDVLGQLRSVVDALGGETTFTYDPFGNLNKTTDPNKNVVEVEYDRLGRKTALKDPDMGLIQYELDPLGQTWAQASPEQTFASKKTFFSYDVLGRPKARYETDLESHWVYDTATKGKGIGGLAEVYVGTPTNKDYVRSHEYDDKGRVALTTQMLSDGIVKSYTNLPKYDEWGRLSSLIYQRGEDDAKRFDLRYNDKGYLQQVDRGAMVLWKVTAQDAAGRLKSAVLGNGLSVSREYFQDSGRLQSAKLLAAGDIRRLEESYSYDVMGNILERNEQWDSNGYIEFFTYDSLNRLSTSKIGSDEQTYTYFADGSIKSKTGVGTGEYKYPKQGLGSTQPHAVTSIEGIAGSFFYDKNGNQTSAPLGRAAEWNSFDMPRRLSKGENFSTFNYGPEHQRIRQVRSDGRVTVYAGVQEVERVGTQVSVKTYWPFGLGLEIDRTGQPTELNWTHSDRMGSIVAITGEDGLLRPHGKLAYNAWGKRRALETSGTDDTIDGVIDDKGYTGHEMLDQLDLVHMNGRVYDPFTAKFLSADPHVQHPDDGQSYNRYSYVLNNPTNRSDPTGFFDEVMVPGSLTTPGFVRVNFPGSIVRPGIVVEGNIYITQTKTSGAAGKGSSESKNKARDDVVRDAMLSSPNRFVAQAAPCVGMEGVCIGGLAAPLGGGWLAGTKLGQAALALFGLAAEAEGMADGLPSAGRGIAGLEAKTVAEAGPEMVRVGRWMSQIEYEAMKRTGQLQEGAGGMTSMATSGPTSYVRQSAPGSVYVEFSVARNSVIQGGQADWLTGVSANASRSMQAVIGKQGGELSPAVSNISFIQAVKK
jgi:RHS repeat-associated protein